MKRLEPKLQKIRETVKDREEQGRQTLKVYKDNDVNPFAGLFLILIQLPILLVSTRYSVVVYQKSMQRSSISLCNAPAVINMHFYWHQICSIAALFWQLLP